MEKKLEVGRMQGCGVGAKLRKMLWCGSLGDLKIAPCLGENLHVWGGWGGEAEGLGKGEELRFASEGRGA